MAEFGEHQSVGGAVADVVEQGGDGGGVEVAEDAVVADGGRGGGRVHVDL
ncbi:Uncharacterised protein [Mycobacteroides abscessus subsp. abscessus]|nr:Uncharacterised protein [Mycobacteroides abscessus subsp. abscessus]